MTSTHEVVKAFLRDVVKEPNPGRGGLQETPSRVVRAWQETWGRGYREDPTSYLKTFEDGAGNYDEVILVSNIPLWSTCEHHMALFWGLAHIGYLPDKRIVGLSKFARLVNGYARRLQVQERLTQEIAEAIHGVLNPRGVGVVLECRHSCMEARGVQAVGTITTTSAMFGVFRVSYSARAEFFSLLSNNKRPVV